MKITAAAPRALHGPAEGPRGVPAHGGARSSSAGAARCAASRGPWPRDACSSSCRRRRAAWRSRARRDVHPVGTMARILQLSKLPDGKLRLLVEGEERAAVVRFTDTTEAFRVQVRPLKAAREATPQLAALARTVRRAFSAVPGGLAQGRRPRRSRPSRPRTTPSALADLVAGGLPLSIEHKLELLALEDTAARLERLRRVPVGRDRARRPRAGDRLPGEAPGGEVPEGLVPQRADEGDPAGAGRRGRRPDRARRSSRRRSRPGACRPRRWRSASAS